MENNKNPLFSGKSTNFQSREDVKKACFKPKSLFDGLTLIFGTPLTGAIIGGGGSEVGDEAVFRMLFPVAVDRGRELVLTTTGLGCHNFLD